MARMHTYVFENESQYSYIPALQQEYLYNRSPEISGSHSIRSAMPVFTIGADMITYDRNGKPVLPSASAVQTPRDKISHGGHRHYRSRNQRRGQPSRAQQLVPQYSLLKPGGAIAWDCEGVELHNETSIDKKGLGRISIVNEDGDIIFDTFVNYPGRKDVAPPPRRLGLGVLKSDILKENGAPRIDDVRDIVRNIFSTAGVIVGHAMGNDTNMLRGDIPWDEYETRDTQRFHEYRTYAQGTDGNVGLAVLANQFLGETVQSAEHDSVEDARATMKLYLLRREAIDAQQSRAAQSRGETSWYWDGDAQAGPEPESKP